MQTLALVHCREQNGWRGAGVRFYQRCTIDDPDAPGSSFMFDLADAAHAACFNVGTGADGGTLISWSPLHCLYTLPDGSCWAEHAMLWDAMLWDAEDLVSVWPKPCCSGTRLAQPLLLRDEAGKRRFMHEGLCILAARSSPNPRCTACPRCQMGRAGLSTPCCGITWCALADESTTCS